MKIKLPIYITFFSILIIAWIMFSVGSKDQKNVDMLSNGDKNGVAVTTPEYFDGVKGYFAKPMGDEIYPGVVMIHEWWGLNDNIEQMAREVANKGYYVLAVDLYDGVVAQSPDEARTLVSSLNQERAIENLRTAVSFLKLQGSNKVASLGWCFGGGQSLKLALSGEKLDATIIYYGSLITDSTKLDGIEWPVLGIFGGEDASIPVDTVNAFQSALSEIGVQNDIHIYPGVGHAFANPSGANYAPDATMDAWNKTVAFLEANLK